MLSCDRVVDDNLMKEIVKKNYSRIPIYYGHKDNKLIIGILLTKSLVGLNFNEKITIQQLISQRKCKIKEPLYVKPEASLESILKLFKQGFVHQAIVVNDPERLVLDAERVVQWLCCEDQDEQQNQL